MKIGILTLPLTSNYGGVLQAWALSKVLSKLGHDVEIFNRTKKSNFLSFKGIFVYAKQLICHFFAFISSNKILIDCLLTDSEKQIIRKNITTFIEEHLCVSPSIYSAVSFNKYINSQKFDAIVVGSDQCWRPKYTADIVDYYVGFSQNKNLKRVAYAASFGVDSWEYSCEQTTICKNLLRMFCAISVREESAVNMCKENFGVDAFHVVDPTMLLTTIDYDKLCEKAEIETAGDLFCYVLDSSKAVNDTIDFVSNKLGYLPFYCMPSVTPSFYNLKKREHDCIYPSIEQWLSSFKNAKMVLCDSFHGCVFSIIYNKPFWVIGNQERGLTRFHSLLKKFNLEDRLLCGDNLCTIDFSKGIDWDCVNEILQKEREFAYSFLRNGLKS